MSLWSDARLVLTLSIVVALLQCVLVVLIARFRFELTPKSFLLGFYALTTLLGHLFLPVSIRGVGAEELAGTDIPQAIGKALTVNSIGFVAMCVGTLVALRPRARGAAPPGHSDKKMLYITARRALAVGSLLVVLGGVGLLITFIGTGIIPALSDKPFLYKHYTGVTIFPKVRPFYSFGQHTLSMAVRITLAVTVGFFLPTRRERVAGGLLSLLGLGMLCLTMKRGPILLPFLFAVGALVFAGRIRTRWCVLSGVLLLFIAVLMWNIRAKAPATAARGFCPPEIGDGERTANGKTPHEEGPKRTANGKTPREEGSKMSAFDAFFPLAMNVAVEQRELIRLVAVADSRDEMVWAYGKTYVAAVISLVPSALCRFKSTYIIGRYTLTFLGHDADVAGGPRIWFTGEAFLNFGMLGVVLVGLLFGVSIGWLDNYYQRVRSDLRRLDSRMLWIFYLAMLFWSFETSGSVTLQEFLVAVPALGLLVWPPWRLATNGDRPRVTTHGSTEATQARGASDGSSETDSQKEV